MSELKIVKMDAIERGVQKQQIENQNQALDHNDLIHNPYEYDLNKSAYNVGERKDIIRLIYKNKKDNELHKLKLIENERDYF